MPVLLYAPKSEVEPQAIEQLVKLAESDLPVRTALSAAWLPVGSVQQLSA